MNREAQAACMHTTIASPAQVQACLFPPPRSLAEFLFGLAPQSTIVGDPHPAARMRSSSRKMTASVAWATKRSATCTPVLKSPRTSGGQQATRVEDRID